MMQAATIRNSDGMMRFTVRIRLMPGRELGVGRLVVPLGHLRLAEGAEEGLDPLEDEARPSVAVLRGEEADDLVGRPLIVEGLLSEALLDVEDRVVAVVGQAAGRNGQARTRSPSPVPTTRSSWLLPLRRTLRWRFAGVDVPASGRSPR